ncbi:MAG: hypothetical protein LBQ54_00870 [Planctomycetaceae bacterium]|jgi:hypothetical protein|nr:hypothetical protein [Planctomycetaceae bacterium]
MAKEKKKNMDEKTETTDTAADDHNADAGKETEENKCDHEYILMMEHTDEVEKKEWKWYRCTKCNHVRQELKQNV